jgi:putative membrane protein
MMRGWNGYGWYHDGFAGGFPWMGLLFGVLLLAAVVLLAILAIRAARRSPRLDEGRVGRAFEILAERYARGEIDADAFKAMKAELEGRPAGAKS